MTPGTGKDEGLGDKAPKEVDPVLSSSGDKEDQKTNPTIKNSFRRVKARSSRACEVCHSRKVRCDVEKQHPCTNCAAFGCECRIPEPKRRKVSVRRKYKSASEETQKEVQQESGSTPLPEATSKLTQEDDSSTPVKSSKPTTESPAPPIKETSAKPESKQFPPYPKSNPHTSEKSWKDNPNTHPGYNSFAFLGSSSNINLLFEPQEEGDSFHYALPDNVDSIPRLNELDNEELEILKFRGAFLLPPRDLCDELIECYFEKIHPTIPVLNRSQFMRKYNDPANPPSLLLLQSMLLAGSRVCQNPALLDSNGSADLASLTFYKRAKALFDANYENDRLIIVQSVALLSWWGGPEDMTKNTFYWCRVALSIAQGFGLHRNVDNTSMPLVTKRTWKKMWWSLFLRDRWASVALGRPLLIDLEDSDVVMITEDDFIEDEPNQPSLYPVNRIHVLVFIHAVKLSEIMGMVLKQQFSINAEISRRRNKVPGVSHCDMAMGSWMNNLPPELKYSVKDTSNHKFFVATLHAQYYTVLCLVHRSNVLRKIAHDSENPYPSWGIAFQAAHMISRILENLIHYDEIRDLSVFYVYTIFSAMVMLLYQTDSAVPSVVESAKKAFETCTVALKETSKTWMVARMIFKLFQQLNSNQAMREKFVKQARKRAHNTSGIMDHYPCYKKTKKFNSKETGHILNNSTREEWMLRSSQNPSRSSFHSSAVIDQGASNSRLSPSTSSIRNFFDKQSTTHHLSLPMSAAVDQLFSSNTSYTPTMRGDDQPTSSQRQESHEWKKPDRSPAQPIIPENNMTANSSIDPDFIFVTNNHPSSQSFYQNFQPSQLFPEPNEGEGKASLSDFNTASPSGSFFDVNGDHAKRGPSDHTSSRSQPMPPGPMRNPSAQSASISPIANPSPAEPLSNSSPADDSRSSSMPTDTSQMMPNTLDVNDWYQYLTTTFQNGHNSEGIDMSPGAPTPSMLSASDTSPSGLMSDFFTYSSRQGLLDQNMGSHTLHQNHKDKSS